MTRYSLIVLLALSGGAQAAEPFQVPVVPCDLLAGGCAEGVGSAATPTGPALASASPLIRSVGSGAGGFPPARAWPASTRPVSLELGPRAVTVSPGTTVLLEVAIGHLNRIVTPFEAPVVHTVSAASTQVEGSVVYVATDTADPVALYIADGQGGADALSLTLAPRHVPPREIRLAVPNYRKGRTGATATSAQALPALANAASLSDGTAGGAAVPYVAGIVELLRGMAQGRVPTGFSVKPGSGPFKPRCAAPLKIKTTQLTAGAASSVVTAALVNPSKDAIAVDQSTCTLDGHPLAASAAWPRKLLAPGEETEVFLVVAQGERMADPTGRPR
jgi:conjugal transfer pilus assembly protein TraK